MFGYVIAARESLTREQQERYKACYCGLCRALRQRHGGLSRLALNYDMTFLVLVLSSLYEPEERAGAHRCPTHPLKAQDWWADEFSDYAADLTVALTYHKLRDDWLDDGARLRKGLMEALQGAYDRVKQTLPHHCRVIEEELDALLALEKANDPVPDRAAACFGRLMARLMIPREDRWSRDLGELGFFLGQFIYLQDACLDMEKDSKKGRYNPLLAMNGGAVQPLSHFEPMLLMVAHQTYTACDRLPLVQDRAILENILRDGIWTRYHQARSVQDNKEKKKEGTPG